VLHSGRFWPYTQTLALAVRARQGPNTLAYLHSVRLKKGLWRWDQVEGHVEQHHEGAAHSGDESGRLLELAVVPVTLLARIRPAAGNVSKLLALISDVAEK